MKIYIRMIALSLLAFLLVGHSHARGQFFFMPHPLQGKTAPDFTLTSLDGIAVNLTAFREGQPAVVFFWATWCPHCRMQLRKLYERRQELQQAGYKIIVVDLQESAQQVRQYLGRHQISLDVVLDTDGRVADNYSIVGIPTFFVINRTGTIVAVQNTFPAEDLTLSEHDREGYGFGQSQPSRIAEQN